MNVKSLYFSAKVIAPVLKEQGGGSFVNISSISALRPRPKLVWYAASKGAASAVSRFQGMQPVLVANSTQATKGLASELAKDNIRCNTVCPVAGETAM